MHVSVSASIEIEIFQEIHVIRSGWFSLDLQECYNVTNVTIWFYAIKGG